MTRPLAAPPPSPEQGFCFRSFCVTHPPLHRRLRAVRDLERTFATRSLRRAIPQQLKWSSAGKMQPMRRRKFVTLLAGSTLSLPLAAWAQQSTKIYRIAFLHPSHPVAEMTESSSLRYYRAFFDEFRRFGYIEGQNVLIERFSGEGDVEKYAALVDEVVSRKFDLVFAFTAWMVVPLKKATSTTSIVSVSSDPINSGLIKSFAHPGGNLTGVSVDPGLEIWGRRLQLFREAVPTISKIGILAHRQNPEREILLQTAQKAGINTAGPSLIDGASDSDYLHFFAETSESGAEGLFVDGSPENVTKRQLIVELAAKYRLPAIYAFRSFVEAGGLMAYGTELREVFRQAARTIDKILRGAKPGDIPYYQPTVFELVINLGTAKTLGLTVPSSMLSLADELIE
jgi:putative tryptophan/tyrosine transport system substrate-binding protein